MNLQRLNHVLLPGTKTGRDKLRKGLTGKIVGPALWLYRALSMEGRFLAVFWLISGAFGLEVPAHRVHVMWCAVSGLLLQSLLIRRFFTLKGVSLQVDHPQRIGVGETITISIKLTNPSDKAHAGLHIDGPLLPWDGSYESQPQGVPHLPPHGKATADMRLRFIERGEHHLDPFYIAKRTPLRLGLGPGLLSEGTRFLVLPKVKALDHLEVPSGARYQPGGIALASKTGESSELVGLRPYRPGDPMRDLCPRAWARTGQPVVREYQQEYFTRFGVVLDTDVAAADEQRFEAAISLAAGVLAHLSHGEALVDLLVFGDEVHRLTLGRSLGFLEQGLDLLACVRPGGNLEVSKLMAVLSPHLSQLSAVLVIALCEDEPRAMLVDTIHQQGVGVRALLISQGDQAATRPRWTSVSAAHIEGPEALSL